MKTEQPATKLDHPLTLVRTRSAGVHIGRLVHHEGTIVHLTDARRLWYWKGAFTLNEASQAGVTKGSRISAPVPKIVLTEAIELIPISKLAAASLTTSTEG